MKNFLFINLQLIIRFKKFLLSPYYFLFISHGYPSVVRVTNSRQKTGQSTLEYFLLFAVIILLTVIGASTFFPRVQASFNAVQDGAIERIINADKN